MQKNDKTRGQDSKGTLFSLLCKCKLRGISHTHGNVRENVSSIATHQLLGFMLIFSGEDTKPRIVVVIGIPASLSSLFRLQEGEL